MWQTNGGLEKLFELESLWRFELISTLSEKRRRRYSETYTVVSRDKRVNEFGDGCGHASTMCRPVLACARKNFFTSPLCTTGCVCEKTLRLFEQAIHFELTAYPTHAQGSAHTIQTWHLDAHSSTIERVRRRVGQRNLFSQFPQAFGEWSAHQKYN